MSTTLDITPSNSPIPAMDLKQVEEKTLAIVTPTPPAVAALTQPSLVPAFPNIAKKTKKPKSKSQDKSQQGSQGENTGRWTAEEHRLFLQGLEEHGKGWKKIASLIKSRTVVQIRTHAQKYFQKLAKARQNGEDGDVSMEGRGVNLNLTPSAPTVSSSFATNNNSLAKRRRQQVSGTKRKALADVVASVHKDAKKEGRVPTVSTVFVPFLINNDEQLPDVSPSALEDSLYRFLTPVTTNFISPPSSDSEQKEKTGPSIILPSKDVLTGEGSPTGVMDINYEAPQWFAKGADVDELLNEAEALDWLADPGDIEYQQHDLVANPIPLPPVVSYSSISMNELPALFDANDHKRLKLSTTNLFEAETKSADETFNVFDTPFDEQAFVTALLDSNDTGLPSLG